MHAWTRPIMECRALSQVPGLLRMIWQAQRMRWWSVSSFRIGSEYTRIFEYPHRLKSEGLRSSERGALARKLRVSGRILVQTCSLVFVCGAHSCSLFKHFRYAIYIHSVPTPQTQSATIGQIIHLMQCREINCIQCENYARNALWANCTVSLCRCRCYR
jgi:hypothetical protein